MLIEELIKNITKLENKVKSNQSYITIEQECAYFFDEIKKQNPSGQEELIKKLKDIISQNEEKL